MAAAFLESAAFGRKFWPKQDQEDVHVVHELVTQLFWRQNHNEAHNAAYPNRHRNLLDHESVSSEASSACTATTR